MAASHVVELELAGVGAGWTDVTDHLTDKPLTISRRFQSSEVDDLVMSPPTFTFQMANWAQGSRPVAYYSPDHANVRSGWAEGIRVRVRLTANSVTRTVFVGWLEEIAPEPGVYESQIVECMAAGWLGQAATSGVVGLASALNKRGDELLTALLALTPAQPTATAFAAGTDTFPHAFHDLQPQSSTILDGLDSITRSGFDRIWEKGDGTLVFESRNSRFQATAAAVTLSDVVATYPGLALERVHAARQRKKVLNTFQVTVHPSTTDPAAVVLWSLGIPDGGLPPIAAGDTVIINAPYVDPNQLAKQVGGVNMLISDGAGGSTIGTSGDLPTADYLFRLEDGEDGDDVSSDIDVTVVFGATAATISITNNSSRPAYHSLLQVRGQGTYDYQPVFGSKTNSTSVNQTGGSLLALDCPYNADPTFAQNAANWFAAAYGLRKLQIDDGIELFCHAGDEIAMDTLLALDVSASIAVTETLLGLTAGAYWVNGVDLEIDERSNVRFTFPLGVNYGGSAFLLGVAGHEELGTTTVLQGF